MFVLLLICLFLCVCLLRIWWVQKNNSKLPPLSSGLLPIIGHAHYLLGNTNSLWRTVQNATRECMEKGGVTRVYIGSQLHYLLSDPEDCYMVANTCLQKHYAYEFGKPFFGDGLVTASGAIWNRHRKLLSPAFNLQLLYGFLEVFNKQARKLVEEVSPRVDDGPFNISTYLRSLNLGSIYMTAFGINTEDDDRVYKTYMEAVDNILTIITQRFQKFWLANDFIYRLSGWKKKEDEFVKIMNDMSDLVIQRKKAAMRETNNTIVEERTVKTSGSKFKPLLDLLLELSDDDRLTDKEIREEIDTAIVAGFDTTSWVLTYALLALGSYPEIQDRVYRELIEVFGDSDRDVSKEDLSQLVYTEAVLKETLRLYSVGPVLLRYVDEDVKLKNYTIEAGSSCMLLIYGIHRHPVWGPDAEEFKPERWLDLNKLPNKNAFAGFSVGKRSCIGRVYALMSMKTTFAHLLRHYRVEADVTKLVCELDFILKPTSGFHITLKRRNHCNSTC